MLYQHVTPYLESYGMVMGWGPWGRAHNGTDYGNVMCGGCRGRGRGRGRGGDGGGDGGGGGMGVGRRRVGDRGG